MTEGNLSCYTRQDGRLHLLALEGTLDLATSAYATESIQRHQAEHGPNLILDTSRLDFIDSKGVGVLISAAKAAREAGGGVYIPNPATPVRKILEMCGLTALFPAELPPAAAALAAEAPPAPPPSRQLAARPSTTTGRAPSAGRTPARPARRAA